MNSYFYDCTHDYVLLIANVSLADCDYIMMKILAVYIGEI